MLAAFGIENDGLNLAVNLLILFLVVVWLALVYWTYADARRRIADQMLVGCATLASLFPFVGTIVYMIVRPPEFLDDVRERELELQSAELRLAEMEGMVCPYCDHHVQQDCLRCPHCLLKLKDPCGTSPRPLDPPSPSSTTPSTRASRSSASSSTSSRRARSSRWSSRAATPCGRPGRSSAPPTRSRPRPGRSAATSRSRSARTSSTAPTRGNPPSARRSCSSPTVAERAARVSGWPCIADAGRRTAHRHSASGTGRSGGWRSGAARRGPIATAYGRASGAPGAGVACSATWS